MCVPTYFDVLYSLVSILSSPACVGGSVFDVVGHLDSFASCSARKPLAIGKKKRMQPRPSD